MASKAEMVVEVKSPASKFWAVLRDSTELFPGILPEHYKSIETVEGDGKSAGTVRLVKYTERVPMMTFTKEKIELVDDANMVLSYRVVDGELVDFYKNMKVTVRVAPAASSGQTAVVNWALEFDKASAQVPEPDAVRDGSAKIFRYIDDYLLKN